MVKPHNKRKKAVRKHTPAPQSPKSGRRRQATRSVTGGGSLARTDRADATSTARPPTVARFNWDQPSGAPTPANPARRGATTPPSATAVATSQAADPTAAALAFIASLPALPGDLATLEGFLPGAERPQLLSAAALAHLRGEVPPELDPALTTPDDTAPPADQAVAKRSRIRGQLAGMAFLIAGVGFAGWIGQRVARDAEAQHWQPVDGEVTLCKSELVSREPDRYEQLFAYHYKAGGAWHTSRQVRFAGGQGDPVRAHRVGEKIKVFVDPKDPSVSVLEPGVIGWAWAQLIAGLVVAALGGLYLLLGGRERTA